MLLTSNSPCSSLGFLFLFLIWQLMHGSEPNSLMLPRSQVSWSAYRPQRRREGMVVHMRRRRRHCVHISYSIFIPTQLLNQGSTSATHPQIRTSLAKHLRTSPHLQVNIPPFFCMRNRRTCEFTVVSNRSPPQSRRLNVLSDLQISTFDNSRPLGIEIRPRCQRIVPVC